MSKTPETESIGRAARALRSCALLVSGLLCLCTLAAVASAAEVARLDVVVAEASRSSSGLSIDKRLTFAKGGLLRTSYNRFTYIRRYPLSLAKGKLTRLPIGGEVSITIEFKGFVGSKSDRIQYYLETFRGKKRQAGIHYSVSKGGAPAITGIDQPRGGKAYVVIVRAPK